jgi:hypothetical protein
MTPYRPPPSVTVDLTDAECDAVREFFRVGAASGPDKTTPKALEPHMDHMASVAGRLTIAQHERDKAEHETRGIP